ncbi:MAG: hypothetical protein M1814_003831 [Vezdaea aestivalis]|nr:MAG: hypothetical protein M1814_003831 [Vezdaea aestivalis]
MEAVGLVASIVQITHAAIKASKYLNDVRHAPGDRKDLTLQIVSTIPLLTELRSLAEDTKTGDPWCNSARALEAHNGPLDQFKSAMDDLARRLKPTRTIKSIGRSIIWTLSKKEVNDVLSKTERLKSSISILLQKDQLVIARAIRAQIVEIGIDVEEVISSQREQTRLDEYQRLVEWISPITFYRLQADILRTREEGTGQWLLDSEEFRQWKTGAIQVLFCPGIPGAGKTVISSVVIDHLQQTLVTNSTALAFLYCNYKKQEEQTALNLLASVLRQLAYGNIIMLERLKPLSDRHEVQSTGPSLDEIIQALQSACSIFSRIFIVIDALDECSELSGAREIFLKALALFPSNVSILLTSRPHVDVEARFRAVQRLQVAAKDQDIQAYLHSRIFNSSRLVRLIRSDGSLVEKILCTINRKAHGMLSYASLLNAVVFKPDNFDRFLLARLYMDSLECKSNRNALINALEHLPTELDQVYDEALQRIEDQNHDDRSLALKVLEWITQGLRTLTVAELQHALAVRPESTDIDEGDITDSEILLSVCAGLVTIDERSSVIRLVHYTTDAYLKRVRQSLFLDSPQHITSTCITYLSFEVFADMPHPRRQVVETRLRDYPLLAYAAVYWGSHAQDDFRGETDGQILEFLHKEGHSLSHLTTATVLSDPSNRLNYVSRGGADLLHILANSGLERMIRILISDGANISQLDSIGQTPMHFAARSGRDAVIKLLLLNGANISAEDRSGRTPLHVAALGRQYDTVKLLLENGAKVNRKTILSPLPVSIPEGSNELHFALLSERDSNKDVIEALLESGSNPLAQDSTGRSALDYATLYGLNEIVALMLGFIGGPTALEETTKALYAAPLSSQDQVANLLRDKISAE